MTQEPGSPGGVRVRIVRDAQGRVYGFQDANRGNVFIKRSEALKGLKYDPATDDVIDDFGNRAGVGWTSFPRAGIELVSGQRRIDYTKTDIDPNFVRPDASQELIERQVFVRKDGSLISIETSYGLGNKYKPERRGGWWRKAASEALGLAPETRLSTNELSAAVVRREFLIKTIH